MFYMLITFVETLHFSHSTYIVRRLHVLILLLHMEIHIKIAENIF